MKPSGPIPPGFEEKDSWLAFGGQSVQRWVEEGGTPVFLYSSAMITRRVAELRAALPPEIAISYAVKANPHPDIIGLFNGLVDGFDIASGGELALLGNLGVDPARVSFAGPGKRDQELAAAISAGITLNLESAAEAERALAIAAQIGIKARLAVRVNPDFELRGSGMKMGGGAKPFGVDAALVPALVRRILDAGAEWRGLHIFAGSQSLDTAAIIEAQNNTLNLADRIAHEAGAPLPHCNLGGGFGIPYFAGDTPIDLAAIGGALAANLAGRGALLAETRFTLELGRYLVGEAGVYLARIVDRKTSHGQTFLVTDGGLHHQLAASGNFGTVVRRNYPVAIANRYAQPAEETVTVVGCLCTPLDRLADQVALPRAEPGDVVAIFCAGAYGASASPAQFLGQGPAREVII